MKTKQKSKLKTVWEVVAVFLGVIGKALAW
jgi:hypothetical protein